ncbi:uncharacterized protein LOC142321658 [Lycorma delicatula]|uniref:uncharacterized protein LOC142321658 n=1 Tax=Lycorma delicatula TaxID=130591 RepID=UPI003F516398
MNMFTVLMIACNFALVICGSTDVDTSKKNGGNEDGILKTSEEIISNYEDNTELILQRINEKSGGSSAHDIVDRSAEPDEEHMQADEVNLKSNNDLKNDEKSSTASADESTVTKTTVISTYLDHNTPESESSDIVEEGIPTTTQATISVDNSKNDTNTQNTPFPSTTEYHFFANSTDEESTTETRSLDDLENAESETTTELSETNNEENSETNKQKISVNVNKLSDQIRIVLQKYKDSGDVIIPNVQIPDPMSIPDMDKRTSMVNMNFKDQIVYGLSNFTVQHINTDLEKMQVYVMLNMKRLVILGNYTMRSFFNRAAGPFNVTLLDVTTEGAAALHYTSDGSLETSETDMDMTFRNIKIDFKNLGIMGSFFQGVLSAVGSFIFEGIKPPILAEVNTNVRGDINEKLRAMSGGVKVNTSISPVDQAIYAGRKYVRGQGYDPYVFSNKNQRLGPLLLNITDFTLKGLSRFYRVGEISLAMDNGTVEFEIRLATDKLNGHCQWSVSFGDSVLRNSINTFVVEHLQVKAVIHQSLDLSRPPQLNDLDFLLGKITVTTRREDTIDVIIEKVINNIPELLRHMIVDSLEGPVKVHGQKLLNEVDVKKIVDEQLPNLDKLGV